MRYVVDIDGTICIPGPTDETRYDQALPIQDRIDEIINCTMRVILSST